MKKIVLNHYTEPMDSVYTNRKKYTVALGNGVIKHFGQKRLAEEFLSETSDFLNLKLHELNGFYIQLFSEYRRNWFYFEKTKARSNVLRDYEYLCEGCLEAAGKSFALAVNKASSPNGNHFVFAHLDNIHRELNDLGAALCDFYKGRSRAVDYNQVFCLIHRMEQTINEVRLWGKDDTVQRPTAPRSSRFDVRLKIA